MDPWNCHENQNTELPHPTEELTLPLCVPTLSSHPSPGDHLATLQFGSFVILRIYVSGTSYTGCIAT